MAVPIAELRRGLRVRSRGRTGRVLAVYEKAGTTYVAVRIGSDRREVWLADRIERIL